MEHARFTPLVMSVTGGMGKAATTFYKKLASMISEKSNTEYSNWIRCKLSFALLRASIISIIGARSTRHHAVSETTQDQLTSSLWKVKFTNFLVIALYISKLIFVFTVKLYIYIYMYVYRDD